jgi:hypothetical protein
MNNKNLIVYAVLALSLVACKKENLEADIPKEEVKELSDLKVNSTFNWSTQKNIEFNVEGFKPLAAEQNVLKVTSVDGKDIFFAGNYSMADNLSEKLNIPRVNTQVRVSFGSINKIVTIENNKIDFSYLSSEPQEN